MISQHESLARTRASKPVYIPASLPPTPTGWTQTLDMHVRADRGSFYCYTLVDEQGRRMPIQRVGYTGKLAGESGFLVLWTEQKFKTWAELVAAWPQLFLAAADWKPRA